KGQPIDIVGSMFGYESGHQLVRALLEAPDQKAAVEARLDERMAAEHQELVDPAQRLDAAALALHNEARHRFAIAELRALDKSLEPERITRAVAKEAARQALEQRKVTSLKTSGFIEGARRASLEAAEAVRENRLPDAVQWKRRQLVQEQMAVQADAIRKEVAKALALFRSMNKPDKTIAKTRDIDLAYAAQGLAAVYDLGPAIVEAQRIELVNRAAEQVRMHHPLEWQRLQPWLDRVKRADEKGTSKVPTGPIPPGNWQTLTVGEFRELARAGKQLWDAARDETELSAEESREQVHAALEELLPQLAEAPRTMPGSQPPEGASTTAFQDLVLSGYETFAAVRIWEHRARQLDGNKDGPFQRYLVLPLMRAVTRYKAAKHPVVQRLHRVIMEAQARHRGMWHSRIIVPGLRDGDRSYTFNGVREILGALVNSGTDSSFQALLRGRGWGEMVKGKNGEQVLNTARWDAAVRWFYANVLSEKDNEVLTAWWETFRDLLPQAQATHKKVFHYEFKALTERKVWTPHGELQGGYVPKRMDRKLAAPSLRQRYNAPDSQFTAAAEDFQHSVGTKKGFTLGRDENHTPPLDIDLGSMVANADEELRFIFLEPVLKDMNKIINGRLVPEEEGAAPIRFKDAVDAYDRNLLTKVLLPTMENAALQRTNLPTKFPWLDRAVRSLKSAASLAYLGFNVANAIVQTAGISNARLYVEGRYARAGARAAFFSPIKALK
ncbi:MAG TPA: hypothetical protein VJN68_04750, partial [Burkholderiaceae bacterium]|nr:hypothetical protein [Burkholderiaceae bacterium]